MSSNKAPQTGKLNNMMTILVIALLISNVFLLWNVNSSRNKTTNGTNQTAATAPSSKSAKSSTAKSTTNGSKAVSETPQSSSDVDKLYADVIDKIQEPSNFKKRKVATIIPQEALYILRNNPAVVFLDLRTLSEFKMGHAPLALNFPLYSVDSKTGKYALYKPFIKNLQTKVASKEWTYKTPIILIDSNGTRSAQAGAIMQGSGFQELYVVTGGYDGFNDTSNQKLENQIVGPKSLRELTRNFDGVWKVDESGHSDPQIGWIELGFPILSGSTIEEVLTIPGMDSKEDKKP